MNVGEIKLPKTYKQIDIADSSLHYSGLEDFIENIKEYCELNNEKKDNVYIGYDEDRQIISACINRLETDKEFEERKENYIKSQAKQKNYKILKALQDLSENKEILIKVSSGVDVNDLINKLKNEK